LTDKNGEGMNSSSKELILFCLITFAWSWGMNLPRVLDSAGRITLTAWVSTALGYAAAFGPTVGAFTLTGALLGKAGIKSIWRRGWECKFRKPWLIPALLLLPLAGCLVIFLLQICGYSIPWQAGLSPAMIVPIGLLIWLFSAVPEEYGWRGYALDRLLTGVSPLMASLLLGLLWGFWHLPLHFINGTTQNVIPLAEFILQTVVLSVLYTWLYLSAHGSILIASLFHASGNLTGAVIPYWPTEIGRWVSFLILLIPALLIVRYKFTRNAHPVG
jgi:membrane protease YdiL (CAAX protease family)